MPLFPRRRGLTHHHLSDEVALSLPSELGFDWPAEDIRRILSEQVVLVLPYRDFAGRERRGQLVVHRALGERVTTIFEALFQARFPIASMVPVAAFGWDDHRSMAANNCVGFHFRPKTGKDELSWHAYGRAIDVNPVQNPYWRRGVVLPPGARYEPRVPGTCTITSPIVPLFRAEGFVWGGDWSTLSDFMHFECPFSS